MKITIIHGQSHRGITYWCTKTVLEQLKKAEDEVMEYFMPKDLPIFCCGCNNCFLKGEQKCPAATYVQPIIQNIEESELLIIDTPNYVMDMSAPLKNFFDHLAYRWVTHRPHESMYHKTAIVICSSAGAPSKSVTKAIAKKLKWMGITTVFQLPFVSNALTAQDISDKKKEELKRKAISVSRKGMGNIQAPHIGIQAKVFFTIFRKMQSSPNAGWNPTDRDWWISQGWTDKIRPWTK